MLRTGQTYVSFKTAIKSMDRGVIVSISEDLRSAGGDPWMSDFLDGVVQLMDYDAEGCCDLWWKATQAIEDKYDLALFESSAAKAVSFCFPRFQRSILRNDLEPLVRISRITSEMRGLPSTHLIADITERMISDLPLAGFDSTMFYVTAISGTTYIRIMNETDIRGIQESLGQTLTVMSWARDLSVMAGRPLSGGDSLEESTGYINIRCLLYSEMKSIGDAQLSGCSDERMDELSSYWSRNGMATPRRELVMAFDHSVIYARYPKESELDEVRKHYTRFVKMWLRIRK